MIICGAVRCSVGVCSVIFFFQAEDGIRDLVRSRGLGDVYKRQELGELVVNTSISNSGTSSTATIALWNASVVQVGACLLYTSDAADERSSVDLGGRRIITNTNRNQPNADRIH